ncbi:MAG: hypothetical protein NTX50_05535 [Candidatus Sumerlaeota bacterium]|nr:hypothetical protein [Candidatus Sumerlaeota bacterium]
MDSMRLKTLWRWIKRDWADWVVLAIAWVWVAAGFGIAWFSSSPDVSEIGLGILIYAFYLMPPLACSWFLIRMSGRAMAMTQIALREELAMTLLGPRDVFRARLMRRMWLKTLPISGVWPFVIVLMQLVSTRPLKGSDWLCCVEWGLLCADGFLAAFLGVLILVVRRCHTRRMGYGYDALIPWITGVVAVLAPAFIIFAIIVEYFFSAPPWAKYIGPTLGATGVLAAAVWRAWRWALWRYFIIPEK